MNTQHTLPTAQAEPTEQAAYALNGQPCSAAQFYAIACDPQRNVVVQACAGAGKTWMLVSRIVRALLLQLEQGGTLAPQDILAITFTKKAAAEMRQRLQEWLQAFAQADDATLLQELHNRGFSSQMDVESKYLLRKQLSNLYQTLLESGRVVQIRTFHSWFGALLRSAPLAVLERLQLPAHYELLEDDSQAKAQVWRRFYDALEASDALRATYTTAVAEHGRSNIDKALSAALDKRVEFVRADSTGVVDSCIRPFAQAYPEFAGLNAPLDAWQAGRAERQQLLEAAALLGRYDGAIPQKAAIALEKALTDNALQDVLPALITDGSQGTPRKFSDKIPGVEQVRAVQAFALRVRDAQHQHAAYQHQQHMAQLARTLIACYSQLKRERAWVDMGDVESAAFHLLSDPVLSGWVQQRLDAHTRHLLIDEFQDTNPLQWQALQAWLSSYAGAGPAAPSVFIVGDPKQSIYRFRRAEPQVFIAATDFVRDALGGVLLSCDHTRRNAHGVLAAVNAVMQGAANEGYEGFRPHTSASAEAGQVLRLPLVLREEGDDAPTSDAWRDSLTTPRDEAEDHIRDRECTQAAQWLAQHIASGVPAHEVMVLSRKRDRLQRMRDALQQHGIAAQISEKTQLMAHCEVQDVVALVDALVSPSHNLSLARALKSPLFGVSDAQLVAIAQAAAQQGGSWWRVLHNSELLAQYLHGLPVDLIEKKAENLKLYQGWFATLPPHDALAALYQHADVIARCMAAAPAPQRLAVQANLQALLAAALDVDGGRFLTPYVWVRALKAAQVKAPVTQAAAVDAVQLLTVHGAKGLEAHTVLMLDANAAAEKAKFMDVLIDWPAAQAAPTTFAFVASESRPPACVADVLAQEKIARQREEINALYVAMTRAQHTLALSAHDVKTPDAQGPWQRFAVLGEGLVDAAIVDGLDEDWLGDAAHTSSARSEPAPGSMPTDLFFIQNMPVVHASTAQAAIENVALTKPVAIDSTAARIGQAMHRLLELYTPTVDLAATAPLVGAHLLLTAQQSQQALHIAQRILQGEAAWVWSSQHIDWQANEVELHHTGQLLRLDRLVRERASQTWWVLDYKSATAPEQQSALRAQLALYQQAVQAAHPEATVRAAFITGEGRLVELIR
jgi:ATP-dependent helicase/nuclease subunit A